MLYWRYLRFLVTYWATVCKTVRSMLSDRCLSCPVCDVGVLWPNGWMDQDETWHAGRPRSGHIVLYGDPASPSLRGTVPPPIFGPRLLWPNGRPSQLLLSTCSLYWRCSDYLRFLQTVEDSIQCQTRRNWTVSLRRRRQYNDELMARCTVTSAQYYDYEEVRDYYILRES